ncbi:hypothetical protein [Spongiactinospora sp. TRM90649]|uniref:hypothetical protein n=1 Tax=Spongiactinospora sp. TRM90649 TaxID=3031114 RepID=UPI0023F6B801|nr:hypothetical protein [Spongiactinospora sp. TRM90649]MDF5751100.1 hypothetical protein [Spongiactinospora sp. TRM90649]
MSGGPWWTGRPSPVAKAAADLASALAELGIVADVNGGGDRVIVSLRDGLVAIVDADGIYWCSPRLSARGRRLYGLRATPASAATALAGDYELLRRREQEPTSRAAHATPA